MPKHDKFSPKAIANRMKAKGLQKLRWFCQMCQKQCRDENGFKCHTSSESHQRQLLLFADNPGRYLGEFSGEFLKNFMYLLKTRFGTKRVQANQVYQEYIADKEHVHMNSTRWTTLTGFVNWLGRNGYCKVDQTEKGWFITWIDRDPDTIKRQEALEKKKKMDLTDEEKMNKFLQKQIENDKTQSQEATSSTTEYSEFKRKSEDEVIKLDLNLKGKSIQPTPSPKIEKHALEGQLDKTVVKKRKMEDKSEKKSALDDIIKFEEERREKRNRKDYWLAKDIVVKIISKKLGDKYYKKKGVIQEVIDTYGCVVKMLDTGDVLKLDQAHLETVIPKVGNPVLVVNGAYRDCEAILEAVNFEKFNTTIKISSGLLRDRIVENVKYEDICKLHVQS